MYLANIYPVNANERKRLLQFLDRNIAKRLSDKVVTINYGGKSLQHIVLFDGSEYQITVDFT